MKWTILAALSIGICCAAPGVAAPLRVAIVGLEHGHAGGFLNGGGLTPAGGALHRPDVEVVAIVEPDRALFDRYAKEYRLAPSLYFTSVAEMNAKTHPGAALIFTDTVKHRKAVEDCAKLGLSVMMEKPLAATYEDALAIREAAARYKIHVLVDYETSWYRSNKAAFDLAQSAAIGGVRKVIVRDGHRGPKLIHVQPEFFAWLSDPARGGGALFDFGCYGADLMTVLEGGKTPISVTAMTQQLQPAVYPKVEDEATVLLRYPDAVAILQGSWNWPFDIKNMDIYGVTGTVKTIKRDQIDLQKPGEKASHTEEGAVLPAPYDDPLHYLAAVLNGQIEDKKSLSSLDTNVIVTEILDAAQRSAKTGKTVELPLR